jgi:monomeric sarcosine oxidase
MSSTNFDVIVIGAGAVGSAAAYHAARRGQRVLLLEQFDIDHQRGSSHGASRIIRYTYDYPIYVRMAKVVYPMWEALEAEAGETLFVQDIGGIDIGKPDSIEIRACADALASENVPFELLSAANTMRRYPQFRLDDDQVALYQANAGALRASRCVLAHVRLAEARGAIVRANTPVERITALPDGVEVRAGGETYSAARLILAAGGWANDLLAHVGLGLPLRFMAAQENYFDAAPAADYEVGRFPAFIAHTASDPRFGGLVFYGIPSVDGSGLKVARHSGPPLAHAADKPTQPDEDTIRRLRHWSSHYLPAADLPPRYARTCLYTMTPDEHFTLDTHPQHPQIIISASCSGHAFKFSTLLGDILVDLAVDGTTRHDISMFTLARFEKSANAAAD